ncbi:MAG: GNAT family N-acetyltransferase [Patescibacteria group bacterium]|nr:GNAT family N-acetyltransferase [Patescibacteria group bacterium]
MVYFLRWFNDPEVTAYMSTRYPTTIEDEAQWIRRDPEERDDRVVLTIVRKNTSLEKDCPIGVLGIRDIEVANRVATIGITIGEKECWGNGYATEAESLLLEYAFNTLNLRKIYARVLTANRRSCRHFRNTDMSLRRRSLSDTFARTIILMSVYFRLALPNGRNSGRNWFYDAETNL